MAKIISSVTLLILLALLIHNASNTASVIGALGSNTNTFANTIIGGGK